MEKVEIEQKIGLIFLKNGKVKTVSGKEILIPDFKTLSNKSSIGIQVGINAVFEL